MNQLSCDTIQDLLPGYIEGAVSEETRKAVEEHLGMCGACRGLYEDMSYFLEEENHPEESDRHSEEDGPDGKSSVDFLKKDRRMRRLLLLLPPLACVIVCAALAVFFSFFT